MKKFLDRLLAGFDRFVDVLIWLEHAILLYLLATWVMPLLFAVVFSTFVFDLRPYIRGTGSPDRYLLYALLGLPTWLGLCLFAHLGQGPLANALLTVWSKAPVIFGTILLGLGGFLYLIGVF